MKKVKGVPAHIKEYRYMFQFSMKKVKDEDEAQHLYHLGVSIFYEKSREQQIVVNNIIQNICSIVKIQLAKCLEKHY